MAYVPVKVYRNQEIRRFLLESGDNGRFSFQQLLNQAKQVFPDLDMKSVKITWKDADGETVVMTTDLELMEAVRSMPADNQMLRLQLIDQSTGSQATVPQEQVQEQQQDQTSQENQTGDHEPIEIDPTTHRNVFCDGCRGGILGIRYKCLTCPDYDLCSECIPKALHDEHPMIRIASPNDKSWKPAFFAAQAPFPFGPGFFRGGHRGFGPRGCHGGRGRGHGPEPEPGHDHGHGPEPWHGHKHGHGHGPEPGHHHGHGPHHGPEPGHHRGHGPRHGPCGRHGWKRMWQQWQPEETGQQEQQQQQQATAFDGEALARDLNNTISNVLAALGIPFQAQEQNSTPTPTPTPAPAPTASASNTETVTSTPPAAHPDPKIAAALNYMLAMGYKNEGGWLTRLLEEKRGDVSAVLDVLHPTAGH